MAGPKNNLRPTPKLSAVSQTTALSMVLKRLAYAVKKTKENAPHFCFLPESDFAQSPKAGNACSTDDCRHSVYSFILRSTQAVRAGRYRLSQPLS